MMQKVKFFIPIVLLLTLLFSICVGAEVFTVVRTHIIDNDDAQGFSNDRYGFNTLFQSSNLYYQDARKHPCNTGYNYYDYIFPGYSHANVVYGEVSAYLYNIDFTDPGACYFINDSLDSVFSSAGCINQNFAAAGWNVIGLADATHGLPGENKYTDFVRLVGNTYADSEGCYCGADAIKIKLGY